MEVSWVCRYLYLSQGNMVSSFVAPFCHFAFILVQVADAEVTNITSNVGDVGGSFSRFTQAAEVFASQAATQAAGLFTYKSTDPSQAFLGAVVDVGRKKHLEISAITKLTNLFGE